MCRHLAFSHFFFLIEVVEEARDGKEPLDIERDLFPC